MREKEAKMKKNINREKNYVRLILIGTKNQSIYCFGQNKTTKDFC
jgi:hypothetical protein